MSAYILPSEYSTWGLTAGASSDLLVMKASDLIDAYCHRQGGGLGLSYWAERIYLPEDRNLVQLTYLPWVAWDTTSDPTNNPTGIRGRYGYGRRGAALANIYEETTLVQLSSIFGGAPQWFNINTAQVDIFGQTGAMWLPAGIYVAHYDEVEVRYQAGYATIPDTIKLAAIQIIQTFQNRIPNAKEVKVGDRVMQFFDNSMLDKDVQEMLEPYRTRAYR